MIEIETRVCGIPCIAKLTSYESQAPHKGSAQSCDSDMDYYGYEEIEFEILDRRGRSAPWLQRKLTAADDSRIQTELSEALEESNE